MSDETESQRNLFVSIRGDKVCVSIVQIYPPAAVVKELEILLTASQAVFVGDHIQARGRQMLGDKLNLKASVGDVPAFVRDRLDVGDAATLGLDEPRMMVVAVTENEAECVWFNSAGDLQKATFPYYALRRA